jgi:alkanesulfonate monooxygenase SsuD/methylene tetrahydromethanopterin reductase-like flavin-dependent oxidoreductase (luciferase family)
VQLAAGGGNPVILRAGARHADIVSLGGMGRTLADGHHHEARWSPADLDRQFQVIETETREARQARARPAIEVLVQVVRVTSDRVGVAADISARIPGTAPEDVARAPFVLLGSPEEMAAQMRRQASELGITRYVIREPAVPDLEPVLALIGTGTAG